MENLMQTVVTCGRFQVIFVSLTQMARFSLVWGFFIMMFGNYEPPWRCIMEEGPHYGLRKNIANSSISLKNNTDALSSIRHRNRDQINATGIVFMSGSVGGNSTSDSKNDSCNILPTCLDIEFEPGSSTIVTEFGLICDKAWIASLIISIEMLAVVPGAYMGGQIGERFGRKVSLYSSTALLSCSIALAIFSVNWQMYAAFAFFIGISGGGILSTSIVFTMEFLNPWWRAVFSSVPIWNIALVVFTLLMVWLRDWRLIHIASAVVSGLTFLGVIWVPESVRWLAVHGKRGKMRKVVKKIYRMNKLEFSESSIVDNEIEQEMLENKKRESDNDRKTTYVDLFRDPQIRSITIKSSIAWVSNLMAYSAMAYGVKSLAGDFYINAIIASVSEIPLMLAVGPIANKIGRRLAVLSFMCLSALASGAIVVVHFATDSGSIGLAITILALISRACAATAWCALSTLSVELFPTVVRNLGYGFLSLVSGAGAIVAPYLIPQDPSWFGICFSLMTLLLIISMVMALRLPETKDKPLADVISGQKGVNSASNNGHAEDGNCE